MKNIILAFQSFVVPSFRRVFRFLFPLSLRSVCEDKTWWILVGIKVSAFVILFPNVSLLATLFINLLFCIGLQHRYGADEGEVCKVAAWRGYVWWGKGCVFGTGLVKCNHKPSRYPYPAMSSSVYSDIFMNINKINISFVSFSQICSFGIWRTEEIGAHATRDENQVEKRNWLALVCYRSYCWICCF